VSRRQLPCVSLLNGQRDTSFVSKIRALPRGKIGGERELGHRNFAGS